MSLLKQDTIKKGRVNEKILLESEKEEEFKAGDNKKYEIKAIIDNIVYSK